MLRKLAFAFAGLLLVIAVIYANAYYKLYFGDSIRRGEELRNLLAEAKSVTAFEYAAVTRPQVPIYSELLAEKILSPVERNKFVEAFSSTGRLPSSMCLFEPHHLLFCIMADGSVKKIHICFKCNEIRVDDGVQSGMWPWSAALKQAFADSGMPVRLATYRLEQAAPASDRKSASTDSSDEFQNP